MKRASHTEWLRMLTRALARTRYSTTPPRTGGLSRRQMLQGAGALGVGLVAGALPLGARARTTTHPRIVIVGAGLAGLNCAWHLAQAGWSPAVYEARDRVGGRAYSVVGELGDGLVTEVGGEFINGNHEDMLALVEAFSLDLLDRAENPIQREATFIDGQHVSGEALAELFAPIADALNADVEAVFAGDVEAFLRFDAMTIHEYLLELGLTPDDLLYRFIDIAFTAENGRAITEQNALNFLYLAPGVGDEGDLDAVAASDERYKVAGGNQLICERLAAAVREAGGSVTLAARLARLARRGDHYELTLTQDGMVRTVEADLVVLALPLSVLQFIVLDAPEITDDYRAAFALGYGQNGKLMVGVDERVWLERGFSGYLISDASFKAGWDSSELQETPTGSYTFFNGGPEGVRFGKVPLAEITAEYLAGLDEAFPGVAAAYNGRVLRHAWALDEFSLGSYSCPLPGQYLFYQTLQRPAGNIWFAGEHTSINFFGYMNGAAESGRRVAEAILDALG